MHTINDEAGITLVEIAVALAILGVVLTTFFTVITGGLQSLSESRERQRASQFATQAIEELHGVSPSEVAMFVHPVSDEAFEFDLTTVSCGGVPGEFDPDGAGPMGCETVRTSSQGAINTDPDRPFFHSVNGDPTTVRTIATHAEEHTAGVDLPDGTVRVTVVVDYVLPNGTEEVRRSALFSEVDRGCAHL